MNESIKSTAPPRPQVLRWLLLLIAVAASLSLVYAIQYFAGSPIHLQVTSEVNDLALSPRGTLKYARWTGTAWDVQIVDDAGKVGDVGQYDTLVLDSSGNPHITYYDAVSGTLKYARLSEGGWNIQAVDSVGRLGARSSLVLDPSDQLHISYCLYDPDRWTCDELRYAYYDGSGWIAETVDPTRGAGEYSSLALDGAGNPHIGYYEAKSSALKYAYLSGTVWISETVDNTGDVGAYTSLALDSAGNPRISYYDDSDSALKYAHLSGTVWLSETVDSALGVGRYNSLALDASGNPHISYYDSLNEALKYAYLSETGWILEIVDSIGEVGEHTSLALDASGNPYISYYEVTNGVLRYAYLNGTRWISETVDSVGDVGQYTSLVLDSSGSPHISYYAGSVVIAAAVEDGVVRLWNTGSSWTMRTLSGHTGPVIRVAFGNTGATLASVSEDGTVWLWDVASGYPDKILLAREPLVDADFSMDLSILATLGQDGVVRVWDVPREQVLQTIDPGEEVRRAVALSPDGTVVATGEGGEIQIWDAGTGEPIRRLEGEHGEVTALAIASDGETLGSGGTDTAVRFWDLLSGRQIGAIERHWAPVTKVIFNEDASRYLTASEDGKSLSGYPATKDVDNYREHLGAVKAVAFGCDPDTILSGGDDGTVRVWDATSAVVTHVEWTQPGLVPMWGTVFGIWTLVSGLLGLVCLWGLSKGYGWSHLLALGMYLIGPLVVLGLPILEMIYYPLPVGIQLQIVSPLIALALCYGGLVILLTRQSVALCYEAPLAAPLAEQLMARRRTLRVRLGVYIAAVWVVVLVALYSVLRGFKLDTSFMQHWLSFIMTGAGTTFVVSSASIVLATVLALLGALGRLSKNPIANGIAGFYVSLIRGTPLLVQIYIWYLGLPRLNVILPALPAGILALGVCYGAYMTEIFRAGIQAIGKGQHEAAHALGMSTTQTLRRIVLPQALRIVIPPIGNEFIAMMKDSSLVSIMTVQELTWRAEKIGRQYARGMETFLIAAGFYWLLTVIFQFLQGKLEDYMARSERR